MKRWSSALVAAAVVVGLGTPSYAAPCRDAKGKFIKCPPKAAEKPVRCKNAKGQFAKCGTPGSKPA